MAKKSTGKIEVDYQKLRDEGNWKKLIELSENGKVIINGKSIFKLYLINLKITITNETFPGNFIKNQLHRCCSEKPS